MKVKIINNNKGLTLVETMIAILLFGVALVGMLDVCAQSILMGKRSALSYAAYNMAKNRLETLRTQSFGSLNTAAETDTILDDNGVPDTNGNFKRNTTVTTSYNGDSQLTEVTVTVDYKIKNVYAGKPASLSTVIFEHA
jgi:prepilin-type N-terminal cleavage/methylation domain-containing protein